MRGVPFAAALLVIMAGCLDPTGEGKAAPTVGGEELAAEPVVTATTGAIAGVVTDEAYQPLAGANVSLRDGDVAVQTDVEGAFTMSGLAPSVYTLLIARIGYESVAVVATVGSNAVTRVVTTLAELTVVRPYVVPYEWGGRIGCAAVGVNVANMFTTFLVPCAGIDPNTKNSWIFDVGETAETLVVTIAWTSTHLVGNEMQVFVEPCTDPNSFDCPDKYAVAIGESPVVARIERDAFVGATFGEGVTPVRIRVAPGSTDPTMPSIVLEQAFTVYVNIFHHEPAPPGFTGVPDS